MHNVSKVALALVAMLATACGGSTTGVVVGFLIDGQTGARLNLFAKTGTQENLTDTPDATKQVYTIINGEFVRALPCGAGFINDKNKVQADGCFKFAGVPYGEELPLFAVYDGYEKFHGVFEYPSPVIGDNGQAHPSPQVIANIRLFPRNYTVDYKLLVNMNGRGINDVTVACQIRQDSNVLKTDGTFVKPVNTVSPALSGVSANDGVYGDGFVKLAGGDLVLGATYHCTAFRKDMYESRGVLTGTVDFIAGVDAPEIALDVKATAVPDADLLYAVWSNADDPTDLLTATGKLQITFNRAIELVPSTADCQTYSIDATNFSGDPGQPPAPPQDTPRAGGSEQVKVTITGDTQMTIAFNTPSPSFDKNNWNAAVTFAGVYVRAKGATTIDGTVVRYIGRPAANGCYASAALGEAKPLKNARTGGSQTSTLNLF